MNYKNAKNNLRKIPQFSFVKSANIYLTNQYSKYKKYLLALLIFGFGFIVGAISLVEYPALFGNKIVVNIWESTRNQSTLNPDPLVAEAGKIKIYKSEVRKYLQNLNPQFTDKNFDEIDANVKKVVINELINQKLILLQGLKQNWQNKSEIKNNINSYAQNLIRVNYLSEIAKQVTGEENIKSVYEQLVTKLKGQNEIEVNHILVASQKEAEEIYAQLQSYPRGFARIAKQKSIDKNTAENGGKVGYFVKGTLLKEMDDNAFALRVGEISKPFASNLGWHIIKISDIRPATILRYEQSRANIAKQLTKNAIQNHINKLFKESNLEIKYH